MFVALFGSDAYTTEYGEVSRAQFYTPALAVFAVASATFTNLAINLSIRRDEGILRRVRGTPLPPWIYLAGVIGSAVYMAVLGTVAVVTLGVVAYDVNIELAKLPAMLVALVLGATAFATWGVALAALARSAAAAPAVANAVILPMAFVSNVFVSFEGEAPAWLLLVGDTFPLRHFVISFGEAMSPFSEAPAFVPERLGCTRCVDRCWCFGCLAQVSLGPSSRCVSSTRSRRKPRQRLSACSGCQLAVA